MKKQPFLTVFLLVILITFGINDNYAQIAETLHIPDSGYVQILRSNDGSTHYGRITAIYDKEIEFATELETLKIKITNIESIEDVPQSSFRNGKYWFPNSNNTRLYIGQKGRMQKKGIGYCQVIYLVYAGFAIGLTDNITLGGGASMFPGALYFTPKVGFKATETFDFAVGALIANGQIPLSILYSVGTYGKETSNFTVGFGYGFVGSDLPSKPMIILGYEGRTSRRTAFVTENFIFPGGDVSLISYGFRFFGKKFAFDLAFVNFPGDGVFFPGLPFVDFVYNF